MGWLYLPKTTPTAGQKGFLCGDVFVPIETEAPSAYKKGICIELDEKDSAPTSGLVFHLSGETDSLTAETGQVFTKTGDSVIHTSNDGLPCWYTPSGQWMYSSDEGLPTGSSPWTQTVWVKCETNPIGQTIVLSFGHLGVSRGGQALSFDNKTAIRSVGGVGQDFTTDRGVIDPLIWNHVAITYDGSTITIYVNGKVVKSGSHLKSIRLYGSNGLGIGGCDWETPFQGWIRDARIYNRALSPSEIKSFMGGNKKAFIPLEEVQPEEGAEFEKNSEEMPSGGLILHVPLAQSATVDELGTTLTEYGDIEFTTVEGIQCAKFVSSDNQQQVASQHIQVLYLGVYPDSFSVSFWCYIPQEMKKEEEGILLWNDLSIYAEDGKVFGVDVTDGFHLVTITNGIGEYGFMALKKYIDGVLIGSSSDSAYSVGGYIEIGQSAPPEGGLISYFDGYLSTVRMYNRALSESEVRTLAREWKKPVPDAPIGTSGILISSSNTISAGKFHKNESAEIPSSGLLLHASLEQDSETAATGQTFTKSGNVTFETVQGMKCAYFDGNSYWQVPFESDLAGNTAKAVSLWMRGTKNTANGSWQEAAVVAFGYWASGEAFAIEHLSSSTVSNRIHGKIYGDGDVTTYDNSAIEDFHHVVFQYDTEKTQLFIDGQLFGTVTYSSLNTASSKPITIGWNAMSADIKFTGYISGVRVYNRALSETEIQNLSNEWQRTGRTNKIFIPVMDKIETEPTMFEKIVAAVNENSGIAYTATAYEFGNFSDSSKWNGGVLAPNGKIYGIPYSSTTVLEIDPVTQTATTFGSLSGSGKWNGGVLSPNGKIYGIPRESETVLEIDPEAQTATTFGTVEIASSGVSYVGGVVAPNGKIYAIPFNSTSILKIDPETLDVSTFGMFSGSEKWCGGVLAPNGKIYAIPYSSSSVLEIDPETDSISTFGSLSGSSKWDGGVLAPNGKIYGIPRTSSSVLEIDPLTGTVSTFGNISLSGAKWSGGVLAPNGKIYAIPRDSSTILEIDPSMRSVSTFGSLSSSSNKWRGGNLAPNGKIYAIPFNTSTILEISFDWSGQPFTAEICTSSYLNKL